MRQINPDSQQRRKELAGDLGKGILTHRSDKVTLCTDHGKKRHGSGNYFLGGWGILGVSGVCVNARSLQQAALKDRRDISNTRDRAEPGPSVGNTPSEAGSKKDKDGNKHIPLDSPQVSC